MSLHGSGNIKQFKYIMNSLLTSFCAKPVEVSLTKDRGSIGLLHGHAGMSIVFFLLAKFSSDKNALLAGQKLLEEISSGVELMTDVSFEDGLAGIGWAVEWLVQNDLLIEVNTDDVLEDIDTVLYKAVLYDKSIDSSMLNGALGKAAYFFKRALSKNNGTHRYRQLCHQECLVMITDDIEDIFEEYDNILSEQYHDLDTDLVDFKRIIDLGSYILLCGKFMKINEPVVETTFNNAINLINIFLKKICESFKDDDLKVVRFSNNYYYAFYLAICYLVASQIKGHQNWVESANGFIEYLDNKCSLIHETPDKASLFQKLTIYTLLNIYLPNSKYHIKTQNLIDLLKKNEHEMKLYNGWGTIILAQLSIEEPTLTSNWIELFHI